MVKTYSKRYVVPFVVTDRILQNIVSIATKYSLYAHQDEIQMGYISYASLLIITSIIVPLPGLISKVKSELSVTQNTNALTQTDSTLEYQSGIKERLIESGLEAAGISGADATIMCSYSMEDGFTVQSVMIDLSGAVITCDLSNIDITEKVKAIASARLGIARDLIFVTG